MTLAQKAYTRIHDDILDGIYAPGEPLRMDRLKVDLKMGFSPIREALMRLVTTDLVKLEDNKGFKVASMSSFEVGDLHRTLLQVEILALIQSMDQRGRDWENNIIKSLETLEKIENGFLQSTAQYEKWQAANHAFHFSLVAGCGSPLLLKIRHDLWRRIERYIRMTFNLSKDPLPLNHAEHRAIAEAVLDGRKDKACTLLTDHILGSMKVVLATLCEHKVA